MNAKDVLLPTDGNGKIKFLAYAKLWPIIPVLIGFIVWSSKRMETGEEKQVRINATVQPITELLERWDDKGGHPAVVAKVNTIERMIGEMHAAVLSRADAEDERNEIMEEMKNAIVAYAQRE